MKFPLKHIKFLVAIVALAAVYAGCTKAEIKTYTYPEPLPDAVFPNSGYAGYATVTITGSQFGDYKNAVEVLFNGIEADSILSCEDGKIVAKVPATAISGKVSLRVWTHTIDSIADFKVMPNPVITSVSETAGVPGDNILIYGANFGTDLTKVNINFSGTPGTVTAISDSVVSVQVPSNFQPGKLSLSINDFKVDGPSFGLLVAIPNPVYSLEFEGNLIDKISGVAATYSYKDAGKPIDWAPGMKGQAVKLAGSYNNATTNNQYIQLPKDISKHKELTVTAWVNWNNDSTLWTQEPIFDAGNARGQRICLMTRMNSSFGTGYQNMISRSIFENIGSYTSIKYYNAVGSGPLRSKEWHHVAMTISMANLVSKIFIDGVEIGSTILDATADHTIYTHTRVYIGGPINGSNREPAFGGMIDNFRIYNQALTAAQISTDAYKK